MPGESLTAIVAENMSWIEIFDLLVKILKKNYPHIWEEREVQEKKIAHNQKKTQKKKIFIQKILSDEFYYIELKIKIKLNYKLKYTTPQLVLHWNNSFLYTEKLYYNKSHNENQN